MTYSEKLKHPKWQKKRLEILQRDEFKCCLCGDTGTELHVHHLKYTKEPHDAPNEDLETLCKDCHLFKTTFSESTYGKAICALKYGITMAVILEDGGFDIYSIKDNSCVQLIGFVEKSECFYKIFKFVDDY